MKEFLIAGNWKMNMGPSETASMLEELTRYPVDRLERTRMMVIPPYISLPEARHRLKGSSIELGAQNLHHEASGSYTGEISASMIRECGCTHVLVGHSERRTYSGETDELILHKVRRALEEGLHPVLCVGENLEQRNSGEYRRVVKRQIESVLFNLDVGSASTLTIAYEPIWAVGTGHTASPAQAQEMHRVIRGILASHWNEEEARKIFILYGGSVKPDNVGSLLREEDVDGGLIGGASLKAETFYRLAEVAETLNT